MKILNPCIFSILIYFNINLNTVKCDSSVDDFEFDILIFTQRWPIITCYEMKDNCIRPAVTNDWMVHGIWPTKLNTIGPEFCNKSAVFDVDGIKSIEKSLSLNWPNMDMHKTYYSLWSHEWLKHGTCAAREIPELDNENKYFGKGLKWLEQYSMTNILKQANIVPGKGYSLTELNEGLKQVLNKDVGIECYHHDKKQYLSEIRICFTKSLELTDCDGIRFPLFLLNYDIGKIISNCNLNKEVIYSGQLPLWRMSFDDLLSRNDVEEKDVRLAQKKEEYETQLNKYYKLVNIYKIIRFVKWATF